MTYETRIGRWHQTNVPSALKHENIIDSLTSDRCDWLVINCPRGDKFARPMPSLVRADQWQLAELPEDFYATLGREIQEWRAQRAGRRVGAYVGAFDSTRHVPLRLHESANFESIIEHLTRHWHIDVLFLDYTSVIIGDQHIRQHPELAPYSGYDCSQIVKGVQERLRDMGLGIIVGYEAWPSHRQIRGDKTVYAIQKDTLYRQAEIHKRPLQGDDHRYMVFATDSTTRAQADEVMQAGHVLLCNQWQEKRILEAVV